MKNLFTFIVIMLAFVGSKFEVNAQALDGSYTVTQGSTVTVQIGAAYQRTLAGATNISYTWTAANSSISIQSKTSTTCTIKGVTPTDNVRLNYQCSYRYDGYARSMNFYYDITVKSNTVSVNRVYVYPEETVMDIDDTLQLTTEIYPANATNKDLYWRTDDYSVASVNSYGLVTARGVGKVKIWAYADDGSGAADYCIVTVNEPVKVSNIILSESDRVMTLGDTFTLTAAVYPDEAKDKSVKWSSSDNKIATVYGGKVTATGVGECDIICSSADGGNVSASCHISVNEAPRYWLSMKVPNGAYAIDVTDLDEVIIKISPDDGWILHSVAVNGELTEIMPTNILTLEKLGADVTVNAVFEQNSTSIDSVESACGGDAVKVTVSNHTVNVHGLDAQMTVYVYTLDGKLILSSKESSFELHGDGIYILKIGSRSFKLAV